MSTTITPTEQNIEINVNNDVIDINVTNEIVDVNATTQQIDINVAGAYPIPNPVLSVFGRTGVVVATEGDYTLTQLGDVTLTSPTNGQVLKYNGTTWVNGTDAGGLTSVGLSMPTAFTVTNSPLTSNGTISVTGAGTGAQYIKGDGTLATFPTTIAQAQNLITEVYNSTGATLTKGTIVYINGGQGNLPTVTKALAVGDSTSAQTYGVVQTDITNMNNGFVVVAGRLLDIDTQAYANGTQLYLSSTTAGTWTPTKQYAPNHLVYVGIVVRSHPTQGIVEIKIQNGYELDEIHNVAAQTPTNNDGLFWESATNLWKNKSIATILGGTPVTGTGTTNYLAKFTGSSTIGIGQVLDDGTSVLIGTTSSTPNVKVGLYSTTQRTLEVVSTNSNALFVQSPAAFIATISNGTWVTNFTNTGRLDLAGDLLVNTIANATTDTDRFLVSDSGVIKYRTGAELLSDIGGQGVITNPITGTGTSGQVAYFNGTNSITSNAAFAFTPTSQLLVNNSVTAASAIARGTNLTPTLTAAANNDVLVGLDISPTFTNGAFTSVRNYAARFNGNISVGTKGQFTTWTNSNFLFIGNASISAANITNTGDLLLTNNSFFNGTNIVYTTTGAVANVNINGSGQIIFQTAPSGTAGATVTATTYGTLFNTGNWLLGTGTTDAGFRLDVNGTARVQGIATLAASYTNFGSLLNFGQTNNGINFSATGRGYLVSHAIETNANSPAFVLYSGPIAPTSGTTNLYGFYNAGSFNPSSGNANLNFFNISTTDANSNRVQINTTGTYSGIIRGFYFNPTITSITGATLRAIETVTGDVLLGTTSGNVAIGTSTLGTATELTLGGSQTASSAIARGQLLNTTLVAAANNDVLVGLDINPTFTNGAFTGVSNFGLRVNGRIVNTLGNNQVIFSSVSATTGWQVLTLQNTGANCTFGIEQSTGTALFGNSLAYATVLGTSNATALQFGTNALTRQTIFSNGNIGINTTTDAGFKLDVNGTARVSGAGIIGGIVANGNPAIPSGTGAVGTFGYFSVGGYTFFQGYNYTSSAYIPVYVDGSALILNANSGGNVGINTITVGSKLQISGNVAIGYSASTAAPTNGLAVSGNVGIGTSTPSNKFNVRNDANGVIANFTNVVDADLSINLTSGVTLVSPNTGILALGTSSTERMRITSTANVLINTTTDVASSKLTIASTTQGVLFPRMTTTQKNAISSPATGLVVFDTTLGKLCVFSTTWQTITSL